MVLSEVVDMFVVAKSEVVVAVVIFKLVVVNDEFTRLVKVLFDDKIFVVVKDVVLILEANKLDIVTFELIRLEFVILTILPCVLVKTDKLELVDERILVISKF